MNKEHLLYISPEDDLPGICTRLEHAHSKRVVLVMPLRTTNLRSLVTWRMLHAYTRQQGIKVHVVSEDAYIRSVARNARFTVAHTLDTSSGDEVLSVHPSLRRVSRQALSSGVTARRYVPSSAELEESIPPTLPIIDIKESFLFDDDDVNDNVIPLPRAKPSPFRSQKAPRPLDIQRPRQTSHSPSASPPLPWDDIDKESAHNNHAHPIHPIRRRSGTLILRSTRSRMAIRTSETIDLRPYLPILCIGLFIVVRGIVQYIRSNT